MASDSGAPPQVTLLSRVTLDYSPDEDRMKLTGLTQSGSLIVAWLTLRLLGRVVPHLLTRYESIAASSVSNTAPLQQSSQPEVLGGASAEEPVLPAHDTPCFLVGAADITQGTDSIILTLRGGSDEVRFAIPASKMAQWLSGVKNLYQVADWPMLAWKDANQILMSSEGGGGSVTLH